MMDVNSTGWMVLEWVTIAPTSQLYYLCSLLSSKLPFKQPISAFMVFGNHISSGIYSLEVL